MLYIECFYFDVILKWKVMKEELTLRQLDILCAWPNLNPILASVYMTELTKAFNFLGFKLRFCIMPLHVLAVSLFWNQALWTCGC